MLVVVICLSLIFFCLINLRANALSADDEEYYENTISVNKLIDVVIQSAKTRMRFSLEPIVLPDTNRSLTIPLGLINLTGIVQAVNGTLKGLSSIDRLGNTSFIGDGPNGNMILELIAPNLEMVYETEIIIMGLISTTAQVIGNIANITINSTMMFDPKGNLEMRQFSIEEFEDIVVEVRGNGLSDKILQLLIETFTTLARSQVKEELSNIMLTVVGPLFQENGSP